MGTLLLDDLADYLSSQMGSGWTRAVTVFTGILPASPDRALLVTEPTGGFPSVHTMAASVGSSNVIERPRIQVTVRGTAESAQQASRDSYLAYTFLNGFRERSINGTRYLWMDAVQPPFQLPPDTTLRPYWIFNIDLMKAPSTSTST